jgi:N utilization substance protein A
MKSEFMVALTQLAAERNLPKEVALETVEGALASAFTKDSPVANQNLSVEIMPQTGEVKVYVQKVVVENPIDPCREISLVEGRRLKKDIQIGEVIKEEFTPPNRGRIAARLAKQVVSQRLREVEHEITFKEYAGKENDLVGGVVCRIEPRYIIVNLGRAEAILPITEQVRTERYQIGQRLKLYLVEVLRGGNREPQLVTSRTHPNLLRHLFELEIPEVYNGTVEIKAIAREAGYRSKVAVATGQEGVDPVGCCLGLRGIRIRNIIKELNGEKIDVIQWHPDPAIFIANALSPASIAQVEISSEEKVATAIVPDRQLSLAIGREGQNARLAAKLTGWRIDIKSLSMVEAEGAEKAEIETIPAQEPQIEGAISEPEVLEVVPPRGELGEIPQAVMGTEIKPEMLSTPQEAESPTVSEVGLPISDYPIEEVLPEAASERSQIRFAEDLPIPKNLKSDTKAKKSKKKSKVKQNKEWVEDDIEGGELSQQPLVPEDEGGED